ncbi:DUF397 domain-containing protein [Streptomyces sp. NPDC059575]|uniref:DUF397 domain-containing protein n=1 Tax=Streptomyces sp. NPDC059575 TaxID=3346872 RepID=UPI00369DA56B
MREPTALEWFKSSYSSNDGPECVEVALGWFKSSYSGNDEPDCVEVALTPATVHIRDSKNKKGAGLAVPATTWTEFLHFAAHRRV